jgi:TRAP-type C4-dicarboxylate transport system substrate-binding protein
MKYMTALPLAHSTGATLIASKYVKGLPEDLSNLLTTNFKKAMRALTLALRSQNKEAITLIQDSGLTIVPVPSGKALDEFYIVHETVAKRLMGTIYPKEVLTRVYDILKRPH